MMTIREEGYYWVKPYGTGTDKWIIAKWENVGTYGRWQITGNEYSYDDSDWTKIGKRIVKGV